MHGPQRILEHEQDQSYPCFVANGNSDAVPVNPLCLIFVGGFLLVLLVKDVLHGVLGLLVESLEWLPVVDYLLIFLFLLKRGCMPSCQSSNVHVAASPGCVVLLQVILSKHDDA